jgi:hypothetical protein
MGNGKHHQQAQTTHRYAHLADDPIRLANEKVETLIQKLIKPSRAAS